MRYKAVIFDLDGVLCTTDAYHYQAWKEIADGLGIPFDKTVNSRLRGVSRMESLAIILERSPVEIGMAERERLAEQKNSRYRLLLQEMSPRDLSPQVKGTLDALRNRGLRLAVGSSSKNARFILERIDLGDFFDAVCDGTDISRSKPDPEVFLLAAERLAVPPGDCLVVEDAVAGVEAAAAAGMDCAAIGDAAVSGKGDYILVRFSDLLQIEGTR